MITSISRTEFLLKSTVIIMAVLMPFICLYSEGYMKSISSYWTTDMQPLFIISNCATAYYLLSFKNWRPSAILLILLTAFSVEYYPIIHTSIAIFFFIITIYPLYMASRFRFCFYIYCFALPALLISMFIAEVIGVTALCTFHFLSLRETYKLNKKRNIIKDNITEV